jgi:hypothetical protein
MHFTTYFYFWTSKKSKEVVLELYVGINTKMGGLWPQARDDVKAPPFVAAQQSTQLHHE